MAPAETLGGRQAPACRQVPAHFFGLGVGGAVNKGGFEENVPVKDNAGIESRPLPFERNESGISSKTKSKPKPTQNHSIVLESAWETVIILFSVS